MDTTSLARSRRPPRSYEYTNTMKYTLDTLDAKLLISYHLRFAVYVLEVV